MKLIIDIDEEDYKRVGLIVEMGLGTNIDEVIKGGMVLPKGHGRLIDADKLEPRDISPEAWYSPMWGFELVDIEDAPTIIEADMENE